MLDVLLPFRQIERSDLRFPARSQADCGRTHVQAVDPVIEDSQTAEVLAFAVIAGQRYAAGRTPHARHDAGVRAPRLSRRQYAYGVRLADREGRPAGSSASSSCSVDSGALSGRNRLARRAEQQLPWQFVILDDLSRVLGEGLAARLSTEKKEKKKSVGRRRSTAVASRPRYSRFVSRRTSPCCSAQSCPAVMRSVPWSARRVR